MQLCGRSPSSEAAGHPDDLVPARQASQGGRKFVDPSGVDFTVLSKGVGTPPGQQAFVPNPRTFLAPRSEASCSERRQQQHPARAVTHSSVDAGCRVDVQEPRNCRSLWRGGGVVSERSKDW